MIKLIKLLKWLFKIYWFFFNLILICLDIIDCLKKFILIVRKFNIINLFICFEKLLFIYKFICKLDEVL